MYLFGEEALDDLADYDLAQESDVMEVVERYLPLPADADMRSSRGALRTVAVRQILDNTPPETWRAVQRMRDADLTRDKVLSELAMVIGDHVRQALATGEPAAPTALAAAMDTLPLPTRDQIAAATLAAVRSDPTVTAARLVDRVVDEVAVPANRSLITPMVDRVTDDMFKGPIHLLADDTAIVFHDVIVGRTFTHRFNEIERDLQMLTVSVDLPAFGRFDTVQLADGREIDQFSAEYGHLAWRGPDGWLDAFQPGDLLAVTAAFTPPAGVEEIVAAISLTVVTAEPSLPADLAADVHTAYADERQELDLPVSAEELVLWLCHHRPDLCRTPLPPVSDWIDAAGFERHGSKFAHDDSVWRRELLHHRYDQLYALVPEQQWREVIGNALEVLDDPDASVDLVRAALSACAEPETLEALADVLLPDSMSPHDEFERDTVDSPGRLFDLVHRATAVARRSREVATAEYLACVLRERCGQPLTAYEHLHTAAQAQPRLGPVVERMGWYCFDRGDARGAMRWWNELDELPEGALTIRPFLEPATGGQKVGRNDPCWCGSGRKFKQCHQGSSEQPALPDRVGWLCRKAVTWLEHVAGDTRQEVTDLAIAWTAGTPEIEDVDVTTLPRERLQQAFADPILFDVALHEMGLWRNFLAERGDLLPDDERLLASSWMTVDRSVHEVVATDPGTGLTLRNLGTGDTIQVRERLLSRDVGVGERICARVVPDGQSHQIIGGLFLVRAGQEQTVLELCDDGDPYGLAAWAGATTMPPHIEHRPGMIDSMFDRDAIQAVIDGMDDQSEDALLATLHDELSRQAQTRWLDEHVPALGGLTPREAAADPTRREQLERLLVDFDQTSQRMRDHAPTELTGGLFSYDTDQLRRELGLL